MTAHATVIETLGHCNPSVQYAMVDRQMISVFGVTEAYVYANLLFFDTYNMTPKHSKRYPGYLEFDVDSFCALCNMPREDVVAALNTLHSTEILDFDEDNEFTACINSKYKTIHCTFSAAPIKHGSHRKGIEKGRNTTFSLFP